MVVAGVALPPAATPGQVQGWDAREASGWRWPRVPVLPCGRPEAMVGTDRGTESKASSSPPPCVPAIVLI